MPDKQIARLSVRQVRAYLQLAAAYRNSTERTMSSIPIPGRSGTFAAGVPKVLFTTRLGKEQAKFVEMAAKYFGLLQERLSPTLATVASLWEEQRARFEVEPQE